MDIASRLSRCEQIISEQQRRIQYLENHIQNGQETNNRQLITISQEQSNSIKNAIIKDINTQVVPKLNAIASYVNEKLSDGDEINTDHRLKVMGMARGTVNANTNLMITNGTANLYPSMQNARGGMHCVTGNTFVAFR
ncbi:MAG: hypothetical protein ACYCPT_03940 [Acidimicrobiales bacterium]